ncbi:MAG: hypothetical protein OEM82_09425 [Acidobacteriota bacterium]|nr:hypothetical protein [Acidobacteriota bacterium]MDH3527934.1 hypothetical protein [Acidobacteriota bacterium]
MTKFRKKLLGILTAWPFAYMFLFFLFVLAAIVLAPGGDGFAVLFALVLPIHFLTILLIIGLQIFYLIDVFKNDRVKKDHKVVWVIALFLGGLFAMPVYWYMNIWKESKGPDPPGLAPGDSFDPARETAWETSTGEPVPPEPHSWR